MHMRLFQLGALALFLAACGGASSGGDSEETTTSPPPATSQPSGTALPEDIASSIRSDAADRVGVSMDAVQVSSVTERTYSDTSLGCPEEGKMYAQVLTEGFQVIVEAGETRLDYRVSEDDGSFRLCESAGDQ